MAVKKQFFTLQPVEDALNALFKHLTVHSLTERIATIDALGRTLAEAPVSSMDLPAFNRSAMDGYAVRASDTFGASDSLPAYLNVIAQVHMGEVPSMTLQEGNAVVIHTGAMIPDGADAVVMIEHTQKVNEDEIEVLAPVAVGE